MIAGYLVPVRLRPIAVRRSTLAMLVLVVAWCSGCTSAAPSPAPTPIPTPVTGPTVSPTLAPTPTVSPTATIFESTFYPYRLTLPPGAAVGTWRAAMRAWQADTVIAAGATTNDEISTAEGKLFIVAARWTGTLDALETMVNRRMAEDHGCLEPAVRRELTIATGSAIALTQACGTGGSVVYVRVLVVHDGDALVISLGAVNAKREVAALDELVGWLGGLSWRNPA